MTRLGSLVLLITTLVGCPSNDAPPATSPDAGAVSVPLDAPVTQPPKHGYGASCTSASDCQSNLCVGSSGSTYTCSRSCTLEVAQDCKDVDAFCVPIGNNENACHGTIETLNDPDDAIVQTGDSVTRALTPLADADLFLVELGTLGTTKFTVTPEASIDVKLEAYGTLGDAIGVANDQGPSLPEVLTTNVQQIGNHVFLVVRNVGSSTGSYTLAVQHVN